MTTVRIHPRFNIPYYSLYLEGLIRRFGRSSLKFDAGGMPETELDDGMALEVREGAGSLRRSFRVYVSANDFSRYDKLALAWCDRYGMVNVDPAQPIPEKVVALGPSFGIQRWGDDLLGTYRDTLELLLRSGTSAKAKFQQLRAMRRYFFERVPEPALRPGVSQANYVFYVSWPWKKHAEVNPPRARFMRVCKGLEGMTFEGGFAPRRRNDVPGIDDVTAPRLYPFKEWLERTRRSALVFNCPAVHGCLGWKLGEFLALGKAMVSLPLTRLMPSPLNHGEHLHFVGDDEESIRAGVAKVLGDAAYRSRLERAARAYYETYLAPDAVVRRLLAPSLGNESL